MERPSTYYPSALYARRRLCLNNSPANEGVVIREALIWLVVDSVFGKWATLSDTFDPTDPEKLACPSTSRGACEESWPITGDLFLVKFPPLNTGVDLVSKSVVARECILWKWITLQGIVVMVRRGPLERYPNFEGDRVSQHSSKKGTRHQARKNDITSLIPWLRLYMGTEFL